MARRDRNAASATSRFVLFSLSIFVTVFAFSGPADSVAGVTRSSVGSPKCSVGEAPSTDLPPADAPAFPVLAESEIAPEGEIELEDGGDYSWPSFSHDRTSTADRVVALHADGIDSPRSFVDAADLSRSCRLTL